MVRAERGGAGGLRGAGWLLSATSCIPDRRNPGPQRLPAGLSSMQRFGAGRRSGAAPAPATLPAAGGDALARAGGASAEGVRGPWAPAQPRALGQGAALLINEQLRG